MYRLPASGIRQNFPPSDEGRTKNAGRTEKYTTEYRDQWLCLTHYPDVEVAESFLTSKDGKELVWNFTLECPRKLKMQIFTVLKEVIHTYEGWTRKEKLLVLQRLYQFCVVNQVSDIETMTLEEEQKFALKLSEDLGEKKKNAVFGILRMSRKNSVFYRLRKSIGMQMCGF